jgi:gamma-D-glutamyl-L-lysine dipeptidyl-peptidase
MEKTKYGQAHLSVIPLRAQGSHKSELVSQLLFNETYSIIKEEKEWTFVRCLHDNYEGWLSSDQIRYISEEVYETPFQYYSPELILWNKKLQQYLFMGSPFNRLPVKSKYNKIEIVCRAAEQFVNTPYLWGGRSPLGVDCSGLMQVVFRMCGLLLPRDASEQAEIGKTVAFGEHKRGDLAFFENKSGEISHVGLVCGEQSILHASGWVRIDLLTSDGLSHKNTQTHRLSFFKNVL